MNILYFISIYQYFWCLHSLYSCSACSATTPTFPSPSPFYQFFSPEKALKGEILMSGLKNKWIEAIDFFSICTTKTNELGLRRGLMRVAEQGQREWWHERHVFICLPLLSLNSTHHMYMWKKPETRKESLPNKNQA